MSMTLDDKLVIGISSRALFDLSDAHEVFASQGLEAYREYQLNNESIPLSPGTGFPLVQALLRLNTPDRHIVEIVLMSRNDGESAWRILNTLEHYGLDVPKAALTGGTPSSRYISAFQVDLYLSAEETDVIDALQHGHAAALVYPPPDSAQEDTDAQVRIAFDGDAVLFSDESERVYQTGGLEAFREHETLHADEPLPPGPFLPLLYTISEIQKQFSQGDCPIRTALVTSRGGVALRRPLKTLRSWGVRVDEAYFLDGLKKKEVLEAFRPHIFFDDQKVHLDAASTHTPSAWVPTHLIGAAQADTKTE